MWRYDTIIVLLSGQNVLPGQVFDGAVVSAAPALMAVDLFEQVIWHYNIHNVSMWHRLRSYGMMGIAGTLRVADIQDELKVAWSDGA